MSSAKATDLEISNLSSFTHGARELAIRDLARRIPAFEGQDRLALAFNLAVGGVAESDSDTVQMIADTLADALRRARPKDVDDSNFLKLAELARYGGGVQVSLPDARYASAVAKLESNDQHRNAIDFALKDLDGKQWQLSKLQGKVVLVNFWATWCPPCRAEMPDLNALQREFRKDGLVVLAISDEETPILKDFVVQENLDFPVLLDPDGGVKKLFRVEGIPQTFVYDRHGKLVATAVDGVTKTTLLQMFRSAGNP